MSESTAVADCEPATVSQESECDFRVLCERSPTGICILHDDRIKYTNPTVARLLEREPDELESVSLEEVVHPGDCGDFEEHLRQLKNVAEVRPFSARCVRSDGTHSGIRVSASRLQFCGRPAVLIAMEDVTAHK